MKILQKLGEAVIPLNGKQNIVLLVIIACVFQFALFYGPALADEAVSQAKALANGQEIMIINDSVSKEAVMNQDAAKLTPETASSTLPIISSFAPLVSDTPTTTAATQSPSVKVVRTSTHVITAYNSEAGQTDDSPCITANGFNVCKNGVEDTIAANFLKFGTKVKIPELFGDRIFTVRDRMNKKHPNRVDVWMKDRHDAIQFGVKTAKIQVVETELAVAK